MATFSSIPTQENPMVRGARQAPVNGGHRESDMND